ncbi:probable calcium-binding protein CML46 [Lactuca sativa]|uniref:probable calcium-binding protein CML46 n=1 Tax=Lactuca sativa TaxID=4236 RepID=UPI000CD976E8|nr:probable calcium-binding protein CML46 [Lactuca sativa]
MNFSICVSNYHLMKDHKIGLTSSLSSIAAGMTSRDIWLTRLRSFKYFVEWVMLLRDLYSLLEGPTRWFFCTMHSTISAVILAVAFHQTIHFSHDKIGEEKLLEVDVGIIMERLFMVPDDEDIKIITSVEEITSLFHENEPTFDELKEAFGVFDTNNDGFIDANELQLVLSKFGYPCISESECRRMIDGYDVDKDEKISSKEFLKLIEDAFQ